mmetsp:Transcript_88498/g.253489  ORF Transcript_88498/g.253489 Transcript_88498/m.253489 type:complete len:449 (-) Transcript_88498:108-1454(-)
MARGLCMRCAALVLLHAWAASATTSSAAEQCTEADGCEVEVASLLQKVVGVEVVAKNLAPSAPEVRTPAASKPSEEVMAQESTGSLAAPKRADGKNDPDSSSHHWWDYAIISALGVALIAFAVRWLLQAEFVTMICFVGVVSMLIFGTANVLCKEELVVQKFYKPFMWNMVTMLGQCFCMPIYWIQKKMYPPDDAKPVGTPAPFHVLLTVTVIDLAALSLVNTTYNQLPGSLIQLLRGCKVAFTCLLSRLILGQKFDGAKLTGVFMNIVGLWCVVGASGSSDWQGAAGSNVNRALAVGIISQLIGSLQFVYEKQTMDAYEMPPLLLAGMEGIIGTPIAFSVLVLANMFGVEDSMEALHTMAASRTIMALMVAFLFCVAIFNLSGITMAKYGSPVLRAMLEIARTAFIWLVEVCNGWTSFSAVQFLAFGFTSLGTCIYGKMISMPCIVS